MGAISLRAVLHINDTVAL
uniref:Uncharacterized protein n=1 Tax=Anguilla anguilla TaxID=7936 RepID=A0A0E9SAM5_ANGAN